MSEKTVTDQKETQIQTNNQPSMADLERGYASASARMVDNMELRHLRSESTFSLSGATAIQGEARDNHVEIHEPEALQHHHHLHLEDYHFRDRTSKTIDQVITSERRFWARFTGRDRRERGERVPGWIESIRNVAISSCECCWLNRIRYASTESFVTFCQDLNALLIFIPVAWVAHFFHHEWGNNVVFACKSTTYRPRSNTFWLKGCFLPFQCASSLSFLSNDCSIGEVSKWRCTSERTSETY